LGEGQLSLTKCLLLTDQKSNLKSIKATLEYLLERIRPEVDLYILAQMSLDTLDYTGPKLNHGSRAVLMGLGTPKRKLPQEVSQTIVDRLAGSKPFCPGCLVVKGKSFTEDPLFAQKLLQESFDPWPLVIIVDDPEETCRSEADFLWTVFMRFDPAQDIYTRHHVVKHHLVHQLPLIIDARFKPSYPAVVQVDDQTKELVNKRWTTYFK
jgi:3-polyprenyl-4-hydroxybenzoate decarboxylase